MELLLELIAILFVAVLTKYLVEAIKKVITPLVGRHKETAKRLYPLLTLCIAIFLSVGVHAGIATATGIHWYYTSELEWVVTGILASLGATQLYRYLKEKSELEQKVRELLK